MKPRYVLRKDPPSTVTTSCGGKTITFVANVTCVKVPWWKWWAK